MDINKENDFLRISKISNIILNILLLIISLIMLLPMIFVLIISFTSQQSINKYGYSFLPKELSVQAYEYIFRDAGYIFSSFGISVVVTILGTIIGTLLMSTYAYVISRKTFKYRKLFTNIALFPMLFSGGLVSFYLVVSKFLGLKDSIWALIFPLAMSPFYIFILRTFFQNFIPDSIIESAKVDGASEFRIFFNIVAPIAKPGIATIALFLTLNYWNDWFNAMLFIENPKKIPIQYLLIKMDNTTNFLKQMGSKLGSDISSVASSIPADTMKMAVVVIVVLPIALAYPYFQRFFVQGLTLGAVKE